MKYLKSVFFITIFFSLILSCKTGTHLSAPEAGDDKNVEYSQYGDQAEFKLFLADFIRSVESSNWDHVLTFFDSDNFMDQASIGIGEHQYLIEGMQLPSEEFLDEDNFLNIDHLKSLVVHEINYEIEDDYAEVSGEAILKGGNKVPFTLRIRRDSEGRFIINPPVG